MTRLSLLLAVLLMAAPNAAAQPANSEALSSFPIIATTTSYTGTNVGASSGPTNNPSAACSSNDNNRSVWWYVRATSAGTITIDTDGSAFDTVVSVLNPDLSQVACNDDDPGNGSGDFTSRVEAPVVAGRYYHIRVTGWGNGQGAIAMSVSGPPITGPAGDDILGTPALALPFNGPAVQDSNVGATAESGEPALTCGGVTSPTSIWRQFQATTAGPLVVRTSGSSFDTVVDVFAQSAGVAAPPVACNDDSGDPGDRTSRAAWNAVAGETYLIRIRGFGGATGDIQVILVSPAPTAADDGPETGLAFAAPAPNPAVGLVRLGATLATPGAVRVEVFDAIGRSVAVVADGDLPAGDATWTWDATGQPAGVYVVRLTTEAGVATRTVSVVR